MRRNTTHWKTNMISRDKIPPYREFTFPGTTVAYDLFSLADMIHHGQHVRRNLPKRPHNRQPVTDPEAADIIARARGMGWVPESERVSNIGSIAHSMENANATTSTANSSSSSRRNRTTNEMNTFLIGHSMGLMERWLQGISGKYETFAKRNPKVNANNRRDHQYYKKVHQFLNDSLIPIRMKMYEVGGHLGTMNVVPLSHDVFRIDIEVGKLATSYTIRFDVQSRRKAGTLTLTVLLRSVTVLTMLLDFSSNYVDAANFSWKRVLDTMKPNTGRNANSSRRNWKREVLSMVLAQQEDEEEKRRKRRKRDHHDVINLTGSP